MKKRILGTILAAALIVSQAVTAFAAGSRTSDVALSGDSIGSYEVAEAPAEVFADVAEQSQSTSLQVRVRDYGQKIYESIQMVESSLNLKQLISLCQDLYQYQRVGIFGLLKAQTAAMNLQTDLLMLEKFTMAYMDSSRQLECAKQLTPNSVAIIMTVNGYFTNSHSKLLQYLKKSGCQVVLITCHPHLDLKIPVHHQLVLGRSKNRKTGKHSLLTAVELMSLRYYCLYYPSLQELQGHLL